MILGFILREPAPRPPWFSSLGLQSLEAPGDGGVHLGLSEGGSHYRGGGLVVIAESRRTARHRRLDAPEIAEAYRRLGHGCVSRLPGCFRFILHDTEAACLFAASSTAPPWPLAYWSDSRTTVICSRVLPMLRCPGVPRATDESYLLHLVLGLSASPAGRTAIRGIRRLGPGEGLTIDSRGMCVSVVDRLTPRDLGDSEQHGALFVHELGKAVSDATEHRRSVVSLSGGLDSAALVAAGLQQAHELSALSFIAPRLDRNAEIGSIDAMERAWPRLHVTRLNASDANELPDLGPELRDDPLLTPLALLPARLQLWSQARETGFQTVIEGEGGDELFSMLPTPLDALRRGHVVDATRHVLLSSGRRALVEQGLWLPLLPAVVRRAWLARRAPVDTHLPAFVVRGAPERPVVREATHEFLATLVHRPFAARLNDWLSAPSVVGAALSRRHLAGGFGLELEWPMLERGVLELVLGLHAANAIRGGPEKPFLQTALAGMVPDEVRLLPKNIGLYRAFIPRVLTSPRSRQVLRDVQVRGRLADLVRFERIEAMLDGLAAGRTLGLAALWHLECVVSFAEWYARASREYGVD